MNNEEMKRLKQEILLDLMVCYDPKKLRAAQKALRTKSAQPDPVEAVRRITARSVTYEGFGEKHTNAEWARRLGMPRQSLWRRLQKGLTVEQVAELRGIKYPQE